MNTSIRTAIEDIERQLDACVGRVQELEDHVSAEIEQQREEMHKLRAQLRRALAAVSETYLSPPSNEAPDPEPRSEDRIADEPVAAPQAPDQPAPPAEDHAMVPEPFAELLPALESLPTPSALVFDDDPTYADPFASVLPDLQQEAQQQEAEEAPVDEMNESESAWTAPIAETEEPASETEELVAETEEPTADVPVAPQDADEVAAEAEDIAEATATGRPALPDSADALADLILPNEAFSSELEDAFEGAFDAASDPFDEADSASEDVLPTDQQKPMSEFDRLLDWSDFESDAADDPRAPLPSSSGDGMTATRFPAPPTVRQERPVAVSRRAPAPGQAAPLDQKLGDDLTVITGLDAETQEALRNLGVISLDEIASWHPADAQRIAAQLGTVSDRVIFDVWVPEAQAALFDRFQQRLRTNRFHNLDEM